MKILIQWARASPLDWEIYDSSEWAGLPRLPEPPRDRTPIFSSSGRVVRFKGPKVDLSERGYIHRVCIQGVVKSADHLAVVHHEDHVELIHWDDDPEDLSPLEFNASRWRFYPERGTWKFDLPDGAHLWSTGFRQEREIYLTAEMRARFIEDGLIPMLTNSAFVDFHDYEQFVPPDEDLIRHGVWMTDAQIERLNEIRPPGEELWING